MEYVSGFRRPAGSELGFIRAYDNLGAGVPHQPNREILRYQFALAMSGRHLNNQSFDLPACQPQQVFIQQQQVLRWLPCTLGRKHSQTRGRKAMPLRFNNLVDFIDLYLLCHSLILVVLHQWRQLAPDHSRHRLHQVA